MEGLLCISLTAYFCISMAFLISCLLSTGGGGHGRVARISMNSINTPGKSTFCYQYGDFPSHQKIT